MYDCEPVILYTKGLCSRIFDGFRCVSVLCLCLCLKTNKIFLEFGYKSKMEPFVLYAKCICNEPLALIGWINRLKSHGKKIQQQ